MMKQVFMPGDKIIWRPEYKGEVKNIPATILKIDIDKDWVQVKIDELPGEMIAEGSIKNILKE